MGLASTTDGLEALKGDICEKLFGILGRLGAHLGRHMGIGGVLQAFVSLLQRVVKESPQGFF